MPTAPFPWVVDMASIGSVWKQSIAVKDADGGHVAHLTRGYEESDGEPSLANAHLIAAAPDLYAALSDLCASGGPDDGGDVFERAKAALAKARGENFPPL